MSRRTQYQRLSQTWSIKEPFFVAYAVEGPMVVPSKGLRAEIPVDHPIPGPVAEPSPLNNRWIYNPPAPPIEGIL